MALASFEKQPYESWVVAANFEDDLETGETITLETSTITAVDRAGTAATADILDQAYKAVNGALLQIRVKDGTAALSMYKITFRAITNLSNKFELDINVKVKEN